MNHSKSKIYYYIAYALMAALICIFAPMSVPIGPIPISLTTFILYFSIFIIGTRGSLLSFIVYMLLGIAGLPVFSGYMGGIAKVAGPTGGYLLGFIPMILIMGLAYEKLELGKEKGVIGVVITFSGMLLGTLVAYAFGTLWFILQMKCDLPYALGVCVIPFIPFDIGKMVIANFLGRAVRRPLLKQGLIEGRE